MKNNKIKPVIFDGPCNSAIQNAFTHIQGSNTAANVNKLISTLRANAKSVPSQYANGITMLINIFYNYNLYFSQLSPTFQAPLAFVQTAGYYNLAYWCTNTESLKDLATFNTSHVKALMQSQSIITALAPLAPLGDTENIFTAAYCAGIDTTSQSFNFQLNYNTIATHIQKLITAAAPTTTFDYSVAVVQMTQLAKDIVTAQAKSLTLDQQAGLTALSTYVKAVKGVLPTAPSTSTTTPASFNTKIAALKSYDSASFAKIGILASVGPLTLELETGSTTKADFSNFQAYDGPVNNLKPTPAPTTTFDYSPAITHMTQLAKDIVTAQAKSLTTDQHAGLTALSTYVKAVKGVLPTAPSTSTTTPASFNTKIAALKSYDSASFAKIGILASVGPLTLELETGSTTKADFSNSDSYDTAVNALTPAAPTIDYSDATTQMTKLASDIVTAQAKSLTLDQQAGLTALSTYVKDVQGVLPTAPSTSTTTPASFNTKIAALKSYDSASFAKIDITSGSLTLELETGSTTNADFSNFQAYDDPVTALTPAPPVGKALKGTLYMDIGSFVRSPTHKNNLDPANGGPTAKTPSETVISYTNPTDCAKGCTASLLTYPDDPSMIYSAGTKVDLKTWQDTYFKKFADDLMKALIASSTNVETFIFSFAQFGDLGCLIDVLNSPPTAKKSYPLFVDNVTTEFLWDHQYPLFKAFFVALNNNGIKNIILAFGGANASDTDYQNLAGITDAQISNLISATKTFGFTGIDLDIEDNTILTDNFADIKKVVSAFKAANMTTTITLYTPPVDNCNQNANPSTGGIATLIKNYKDNPSEFSNDFDALNIMAYSGGLVNEGSALEKYTNTISLKAMTKGLGTTTQSLNIGFSDGGVYKNYPNPASTVTDCSNRNACCWPNGTVLGYTCKSTGSTPQAYAKCAVELFSYIQTSYGKKFGVPFVWPDTTGSENLGRYAPKYDSSSDVFTFPYIEQSTTGQFDKAFFSAYQKTKPPTPSGGKSNIKRKAVITIVAITIGLVVAGILAYKFLR